MERGERLHGQQDDQSHGQQDETSYRTVWHELLHVRRLRVVASTIIALVAVLLAAILTMRLLYNNPLSVVQVGLPVNSVSISRGVGDLIEPPITPAVRSVDVYRGYGTWVDVFDYSPPYAGDFPAVTHADLDQMAAHGVETVYLQAARADSRSPQGIQDRWLLAKWLVGAHERGMAVVAWYLPKWKTDGSDLERMRLIDTFEAFGHRFDGVAVDIEWRDDDLTPEEHNARLVAFSRLVTERNDGPTGAIVLPPVQIEVINLNYWPDFPWSDLSSLYDVWLPMSYWSFRSGEYGDGYTYHEESVRRLRNNLGDDAALVHGIGGIGGVYEPSETGSREPKATIEEIHAFTRALEDTNSIGGSIYDWNTLSSQARAELAEYFVSTSGG